MVFPHAIASPDFSCAERGHFMFFCPIITTSFDVTSEMDLSHWIKSFEVFSLTIVPRISEQDSADAVSGRGSALIGASFEACTHAHWMGNGTLRDLF